MLITKAGNRRALTVRRIDKLTLGQLADAFGQIQAQNHSDVMIRKVLTRLNKDRIGVVHHKAKTSTETRLRKKVGQHMWSVVAVLRELLGTT